MTFQPDSVPLYAWQAQSQQASTADVFSVLRKPQVDLLDLPVLLSKAAGENLEALAQKAQAETLRRFGPVMQMFAPLYLSNKCVNICTYCGFSRDNDVARKTLTLSEVETERDYLADQGFRHALLVAGEFRKDLSMDFLEAAIRCMRKRMSLVALEIEPLEAHQYQRLVQAGLECVVVYQETYNRNRYKEVHVAGPKARFDYRLHALERAARGGARVLGAGVLLGLSPWQDDIFALAAHLDHLARVAWKSFVVVSLPRLRPHAGDTQAAFPVEDATYVQILCALRLVFPNMGLVLSTRESPSFRDAVFPLGVTMVSAGSKTNPGGYVGKDPAEVQFEIEDQRTPAEVASRLSALGYEPVWKDAEEVLSV